jgi:hypothetical protein
LHGALALTPVIFTLTLFNQLARNNTNFWRLITYIPNLSYGKGTADKTKTQHKMQDEHTCLSCAFQSLRKISEEGGLDLVVLREQVRVRVWIHFFIGDTEGDNKWLGQYPGNREGVQQPYHDCKCSHDKLNTPNPTCDHITLMDVNEAKRRKRVEINKRKNYFKSMSWYDVRVALLEKHIPLSDDIH